MTTADADLAPWDCDALLASPFHGSVLHCLQRLPRERFPELSDLNALRPALAREIRSGGGAPITFVPAAGAPAGAAAYERRIFHAGEVATRSGSWHDLFNALVWLSFPRAKAALNALHVGELEKREPPARSSPGQARDPGARGRLRDQATLFDEGGMLVASSDARLSRLLRDFQWRSLFVDERSRVASSMGFFVFGHALLMKARQPYKAMAARALVLPADPSFFGLGVPEQLAWLDEAGAQAIGRPDLFVRRESFTPVPVMGIPGWSAESRTPGYYDDAAVFRPRNSARSPSCRDRIGSASGLKYASEVGQAIAVRVTRAEESPGSKGQDAG